MYKSVKVNTSITMNHRSGGSEFWLNWNKYKPRRNRLSLPGSTENLMSLPENPLNFPENPLDFTTNPGSILSLYTSVQSDSRLLGLTYEKREEKREEKDESEIEDIVEKDVSEAASTRKAKFGFR